MPYDLIITASHRPALLKPTLESLLARVDQPPARILIHDDAVPEFKARPVAWRLDSVMEEDDVVNKEAALVTEEQAQLRAAREETKELLVKLSPPMPVVYTWSDPPRRLGMALRWLLDNVATEYVLYSQDDHVVVRKLPIADALDTMIANRLHQIRFNKRATLSYKHTWQGRWRKEQLVMPVGAEMRTVTISDHWYFQTGLWRVAPIKAAITWLTETQERRDILWNMLAEEAVNHTMDGRFGPIPGLDVPVEASMEPATRARTQRTFIWGPIGEDRYIRHIGGGNPTSGRDQDGGVDDPAKAWREISEHNAREEGA